MLQCCPSIFFFGAALEEVAMVVPSVSFQILKNLESKNSKKDGTQHNLDAEL